MTGGSGQAGRVVHREYVRRRSRLIAYGQWRPWADAGPVRDHVLALRRRGVSYRAIGCAAGVSAMTVHHLVNGCPGRQAPVPDRIRSGPALRLLAVGADAACTGRADACGSRRRLRALVALGHPPAALAGRAGISASRMRRLLDGQTRTVDAELAARVRALYEHLWNQLPAEGGGRQRAAVQAARRRAAAGNWPPPMGLDDDRLDDPDYRTRTAWRKAAGYPQGTDLGMTRVHCDREPGPFGSKGEERQL